MGTLHRICLFIKNDISPKFLFSGGSRVNHFFEKREYSIFHSSEDVAADADNSTSSSSIVKRTLENVPSHKKPQQAWLETLNTIDEKRLGLIDLHPDVFGELPRVDLLYQNVEWQRKYRKVRYDHTKTRAEVRGGGRKPWPQKGLGRARHGSIRSPLWKKGGRAHGPRSPQTYFYMLPFFTRVHGLISCFSAKQAQDDLHIVDSLEIPTEDSKFIEDLVEQRNWGPSVLFVDVVDIMPRNITIATDTLQHINLMPVYGLNVYSMLKHDTLVLTTDAVQRIEEKILYQLNRPDIHTVVKKFRINHAS